MHWNHNMDGGRLMDNPILSLLADLYMQLTAAQADNASLRKALAEAQTPQPPTTSSHTGN
jgi:hypothetical protein